MKDTRLLGEKMTSTQNRDDRGRRAQKSHLRDIRTTVETSKPRKISSLTFIGRVSGTDNNHYGINVPFWLTIWGV